jgi:hypothetical protein
MSLVEIVPSTTQQPAPEPLRMDSVDSKTFSFAKGPTRTRFASEAGPSASAESLGGSGGAIKALRSPLDDITFSPQLSSFKATPSAPEVRCETLLEKQYLAPLHF